MRINPSKNVCNPTMAFWGTLQIACSRPSEAVWQKWLKVKQIRNDFFKPTFLPKNERTNLTLLLVDLFLFVFWKKVKTPKRHFEINWPLQGYQMYSRTETWGTSNLKNWGCFRKNWGPVSYNWNPLIYTVNCTKVCIRGFQFDSCKIPDSWIWSANWFNN